jgi:hypothetical protein
MYTQIEQFGIDKGMSAVIEEAGIAGAYIREYYRRLGKKVLRIDKNLGDYQQQRLYDLVDTLGVRWEVKTDRLVFTTGNVYLEEHAYKASEADKYLIFAGFGYVVSKSAIGEEFASNSARTPGGDNDRSSGLLLPLERLEEISEQVIIL